jgi:hypothetical protein
MKLPLEERTQTVSTFTNAMMKRRRIGSEEYEHDYTKCVPLSQVKMKAKKSI